MGGWFTRFCNDSRQWDGRIRDGSRTQETATPALGPARCRGQRLRRSGGPGWSCN